MISLNQRRLCMMLKLGISSYGSFSTCSHTPSGFREDFQVFSSHHEDSCLSGKTTDQPLLVSQTCQPNRDLWSVLGMSAPAAQVLGWWAGLSSYHSLHWPLPPLHPLPAGWVTAISQQPAVQPSPPSWLPSSALLSWT